MKLIDYFAWAVFGTPQARAELAKAVATKPDIRSGVAELVRQCKADAAEDVDAPIFLLSAGWRSGSTLLQRLIMSDSHVLLWGEPYDECGVIPAMANSVKAFRGGWPPPDYYYRGKKLGELSGDWIANLFPDADTLRRGHRAFFDTTFAQPARHAGAVRWGIKEVRLSANHAHYLRWLYPKAKFIFLLRNPLDAYVSYRRYGRNWYDTWPDKPVFTPTAFGVHWRTLAQGFLSEETALDALVVRYEDLVGGDAESVRRIETYLDARLDQTVLGKKIGSSERGGEQALVSRLEKALLRRAVSPLALELGYRW